MDVISQITNTADILLKQKDQGKKIRLIKMNSLDFRKSYLEQRARGAYVATIYQPEALFDMSAAAQHKIIGEQEVKALNKRLKWQMNNLDRELHFIPLDLSDTKIFVFVDASLANNNDFSSQIGYIILIANQKSIGDHESEISGNILHYSSTKCKRITRSTLASEVYGMVSGVDMAISINSTIKIIWMQLGFEEVPIIICTDSYSLYDCLVK